MICVNCEKNMTEVECPHCSWGEVECRQCCGDGVVEEYNEEKEEFEDVECDECSGDGVEECEDCYGSGVLDDEFYCDGCDSHVRME